MVVQLSLQQLLQTKQLLVNEGRLANHRLVDIQDHVSRSDEDRSKSVVNQVPEEEKKEMNESFEMM